MAPRNILITGASGGIGAALARLYAAPDITLVLWGRNRERLERIQAECRARGAIVEIDSFDLADLELAHSRILAADRLLPLDLAVFNAGVGGEVPRLDLAESAEKAREKAALNFASPATSATALAQSMAERRRGHIVFVGSVAGSFPLPMAPTYSGSKAGLAMFAEALRLRMGRHGVAVTLVAPGFVDTEMSRGLKSPRPFLISAEAAALSIVKKLARRPARIVVPWQFAVLLALAHFVPRSLTAAVLRRL
jgi:short-subunit dehydrogenase